MDLLLLFKQFAIDSGHVVTSLALLMLRGEFTDQRRDAPGTCSPDIAQLIGHQHALTLQGIGEAHFKRGHLFLQAAGDTLLLFDTITFLMDFRLQLGIGPLDVGPIAEQLEHAFVVFQRRPPKYPVALFQTAQQARIDSGKRPASARHGSQTTSSAAVKLWPLSMQYSSHLLSIMLSAQR